MYIFDGNDMFSNKTAHDIAISHANYELPGYRMILC